jgi:tetratricopeptide (TPR) repeat protein
VVKHLALMDFDTAVEVLRSAERFLEAHYAVAPTRYDTRQIAAEIVKWKIGEQLPTLKVAGAARGIVLGGRSAEEGEALLKAWEPRDPHGLVLATAVGGFAVVIDVYEERPWEAVAYRFSYIHERPLDVRKAVRITPDMFLTADYARYLAGFRVEEKALEVLRKAVEYSRIMRILERAEELRMTPMAVERFTAEAERLRQEVLQETAEIYRKFREEFFFVKDLLEGRRVVRREVPEVREVVKAFEEAVAEALEAPQRRERLFREVFMERVERLLEEHARRGDVEAVERIRHAAGELAKISEAAGWRAVEDVALVLPAVGKAFEEAVRAVGESRDISRLAEAFRARAEEVAKQLEQQGMRDAAERVRRAAKKIAEEVYVGGWWAVERLRPLLSPERGGDVLGRLEFMHALLATEALDTYRGLVYLRHVEELVKEVKSLASAPGVAEEVLRRAAEAVPSAKNDVEKTKAALKAGRLAEAAEGLLRVVNAAEEWEPRVAKAAGGVEEVVAVGREAEAAGRRISELLPRAEALNADVVKTALEAAVNRDYGRALALVEAAERSVNERLAAVRDVEHVARALERLGVVAMRLGSPERAVREVEEAAESLRTLADLPTAVQRVDAEKTAKAAEAFGFAETAALFKVMEKVRKEAGDVYPVFVKAVAEALKAPEGERAETFRRVFASETEKMAKAFEERGLKTEAENVRRAAETALKAAESIAWRAPEEITQRLPSAVEKAEKLIVKLRDEAVVRQVAEYGYYSALASLAREAKEVVTAKRDAEERLVKLIDDVKPVVELVAPHLAPLLERLRAGDYSVLPAVEAELPKLAERQRQLNELVKALGKARESLESAARIDKKVRELEKALKKAPEDVKAVFDVAFKALERRDFEKAVVELDKILKAIEEKKARLEPLEGEVQRAKEAAERLGLEKVVKASERPSSKTSPGP